MRTYPEQGSTHQGHQERRHSRHCPRSSHEEQVHPSKDHQHHGNGRQRQQKEGALDGHSLVQLPLLPLEQELDCRRKPGDGVVSLFVDGATEHDVTNETLRRNGPVLQPRDDRVAAHGLFGTQSRDT